MRLSSNHTRASSSAETCSPGWAAGCPAPDKTCFVISVFGSAPLLHFDGTLAQALIFDPIPLLSAEWPLSGDDAPLSGMVVGGI